MSTRCQLRFTAPDSDRVAQIYRHSDGYPESVVSNLQHLRGLLQATQTQRDPSYAAAQFLFVDKLWSLERTFRCQDGLYEDFPATVGEVLSVESWRDVQKTPLYFLGHGVEDPRQGIHGDEEFLYVVELPDARSEDWHLKVAGQKHFPRWDSAETTEAFEQAEWVYEGTLGEALTKVGEEE